MSRKQIETWPQYGWWGLAYLESLLRLSDWKASKEEASKENRKLSSIVFHGIEGSNPLGFLAAVGALRLFDLVWREQGIQLRWIRDGAGVRRYQGCPHRTRWSFAIGCTGKHHRRRWRSSVNWGIT